VLTGLHLDATMSNAAVHAEAVALGRAAERDGTVRAVATVSRPEPDADRFPPIAPCGSCRELLADYAPGARVVVPAGDPAGATVDVAVRRVETLLPDAAWHDGGV
jgi:cytidine deaminase